MDLMVVLQAGRDALTLVWVGGAVAAGAVGGETVRRWRSRRQPTGQAVTEALTQARSRADERAQLTCELHDVVTHHLSNVSLQVMSERDGTEPAHLRQALRRAGDATDLALTELRLMARVLRDDPAAAPGAEAIAALTRPNLPTTVAADWTRQLTAAGFAPTVEVPAAVDGLGMTVRRTLTRALEVSGDNILAHAAPRTACAMTVALDRAQVVLRTVNVRPGDAPAERWGRSLRGLRERVDLTGGTLTAGPESTDWVLVLTVSPS